jgi:hypothetical protein
MRMFLFALLVLFPAGLSAQMVSAPAVAVSREDHTISYGWLSNAMGFSFCLDGRGHSFIVPGLSEIDYLDTEAHEAVHRQQYERFPSCEAFDKYVKTYKGQLLVEAEAYAAGICVSVKLGADSDSLHRNYSERIARWVMMRKMSPLDVYGVLRNFTDKMCPR